MANHAFRLYPRGFLGVNFEHPAERDAFPASQALHRLQYQIESTSNTHQHRIANPTVQALYARYLKGGISTGDFGFRKQVLQAAFAAFGVSHFNEWFFAQYKSPLVTDLHGRFLEDTVRYLETGVRELAMETWGSLVGVAPDDSQVAAPSSYVHAYFGNSEPGITRQARDDSMVNTLQAWCSHPNGVEDLLGTLHLLFGTLTV